MRQLADTLVKNSERERESERKKARRKNDLIYR